MAHLCSLGLVKRSFFGRVSTENLGWIDAPPEIAELTLLNLATVVLFLDYVAKLEGFEDSTRGEDRSRFRHLPWCVDCIWLPIRFAEPKVPLMKDRGFPVFLGSCQTLLDELQEIRSISKIALGDAPSGYDFMRSDFKAFYRSKFELEDEAAMTQWVWRGLYDGVQTAIEHSAPLIGNGG
jgi:hypothetical protein